MWNDIPVWAFDEFVPNGDAHNPDPHFDCNGCGDEGPAQRTPDLSSIIQEIIDQPGWASGNPIALMLAPQTFNFNRTANSWESGDSNGPDPPVLNDGRLVNLGALLHVEFVPEPASLALVTIGMLGLLAVRRRRC